ncbi:hypothetical protein SNEBB_002333 [Seison nebaliae]|nr:hypothetical protein SNEBB_002333 [Seison nebaliae]
MRAELSMVISFLILLPQQLFSKKHSSPSKDLWKELRKLTPKSRKMFQRVCLCGEICSCEEIYCSPLIKFKRIYQALYSRKHLFNAYACFVKAKLGKMPPTNLVGKSRLCCKKHYRGARCTFENNVNDEFYQLYQHKRIKREIYLPGLGQDCRTIYSLYYEKYFYVD